MKKLPPIFDLSDDDDDLYIEPTTCTACIPPKDDSRFPEGTPADCRRGDCKRFFLNHNKMFSIAMYASPTVRPKQVCIYAFSCGTDIHEKTELKEGETPVALLKRIIPLLMRVFEYTATKELLGTDDYRPRIN